MTTAAASYFGQFILARSAPAAPDGWPRRQHAGWHLASHPSLPVVEFKDRFNNVATSSTLPVSATLAAGIGTLGGTATVNAQAGRATGKTEDREALKL